MTDLNSFPLPALRAIYADARKAAVLAGGADAYARHGGFDAFAAHYIEADARPIDKARAYTRFALGQIRVNMGNSQFIPPSPETLAWGGDLGGEWVPAVNAKAEEIVADILARAGQ
jgi:hypothetical protein